jgi:hypothetical protein
VKKKKLITATVAIKTQLSKRARTGVSNLMTVTVICVSIFIMSARQVAIALAVVLCAGALLFATDYASLLPTSLQSAHLDEGR